MIETYYQILGISPKSSPEQIKAAYDHVASHINQEGFLTEAKAAEAMKILDQAYATLSDPVKRKQYDASLKRMKRPPDWLSGLTQDEGSPRPTQTIPYAKLQLAGLILFWVVGFGYIFWRMLFQVPHQIRSNEYHAHQIENISLHRHIKGLQAGSTVIIDYTAQVHAGTLVFSLRPDRPQASGSEPVWQIQIVEDMADKLEIPYLETGNYLLEAKTSEFSGHFTISWSLTR